MPRPFFPHAMHDLVNAVDGGLGLVVADMPDGTLWMLKRNRKTPGYLLSLYADTARSRLISSETILDRREALNKMAEVIGMGEAL